MKRLIFFTFGLTFLQVIRTMVGGCPEGTERHCMIGGKPGLQVCSGGTWGLCEPLEEGTPSPTAPAVSGTWEGNDGAIYYLRQIGTQLWWAGLSVDSPLGINDLQWGLRFSNVFEGHISTNGVITGDWADVPRGSTLNSGSLTLTASANQIHRQSETGGFGATVWTRINRVVPGGFPLPLSFACDIPFPVPGEIPVPLNPFIRTDIYPVFCLVKKNQNAFRDHSLLDNLKPAKAKPVVIFGNIIQARYALQFIPYPPWFKLGDPDLDPMHVNYPATADRSYGTFICLGDGTNDGDIDFNIQVDRANLDAQIGFWNDSGWETSEGVNATNFRNKLDYSSELVQKNTLHIESIMYGGTTECGDDGNPAFLLPGWQQAGATGVLFNGRPIAGQMAFTGGTREDGESTLNSILGRKPRFGDRVRITGILALDCGHGLEHDCGEDEADAQHQEIHPVYSIDFVQDFRIRPPAAMLTGAWSADDAGTYFVRQVGNTVWWLGLSVDEGVSFANVFRGTLQNGQVSGTWADIPLGQTSNSGSLTVLSNQGRSSTTWTRAGDAGAFGGSSWQKLYDVGANGVVVVVEGVTGLGTSFPPSAEPFELVVGNQRTEAKLVNPRPVSISTAKAPANAKPNMQADLGSRFAINLPAVGPIRMAASFAGYRATWTIPEANLKPGVYEQTLSAPRVPRVVTAPSKKSRSEVTDRDSRSTTPISRTETLPQLTIRYRIEAADSSGGDETRLPRSEPQVRP